MKLFNEKNFYYKNTIVQAYYYEDKPGFRINICNMELTKYVPLHFSKFGPGFWDSINRAVTLLKCNKYKE